MRLILQILQEEVDVGVLNAENVAGKAKHLPNK